ncbi:MAG: Phycobiliprotein ApcE [Prochlorococcus marinus str. MIT 9215]|nr:MAG: Phycobiliprotein ApcE [Prochlorococcus marinus str. MIT 9215]
MLQTFVHVVVYERTASRSLYEPGTILSMTVTASSGSPRVSPQLYDTLPLSSVRQAEQQDRFPDGGELDTLTTFFKSGQDRIDAARFLAANADAIVGRAANRIFSGGTPLSFLDAPLSTGDELRSRSAVVLESDQQAFSDSIRTYAGTTAADTTGNVFTRLLAGVASDTDIRVVIPTGFSPISVTRYGPERMRKSVRDLGWFLRYVGYALVAGDPSILAVNTRSLRDLLEKGCSLAAANVALQEMRAASAELLKDRPEARRLTIDCFNVLLEELAIPTPSSRQRLGSAVQQGLQLPAIYALAAEGAQRFIMRPGMTGAEKAEVIRATYRQIFERDIAKGYSQNPCPVEVTQVSQGQISMREFIRSLGHSKEYRQQFYGRFVNSRVVELAYRHFLGRGISSIEEFRKAFSIVSEQGLNGLVDELVNSMEYAQVFGEETVPYLRDLGEEAQESAGWGSNRKLFRFSAPFEGSPQYITLYASYRQPFGDQHVYGGGNDPIGLQYGAIFPSGTASVATRPAPFSYDSRRILVGNGMASPGQMASPDFRESLPRRVGPKVIKLEQIATGGSSIPKRGGKANLRNTESSTQAVIKAVYVQLIGNSGYEGERLSSAEARLENGDINLREFVRQVASSNAFRSRYWSGLYVVKAIEVMHRHLLGRPTFGRWEIDALFDTAARHGFYGVVDALVNGKEYNECFGESTVPYERFITPTDLSARRAPALCRPLNLEESALIAGIAPTRRPNPPAIEDLRLSGDVIKRNLGKPSSQAMRGAWKAEISDTPPPARWASLAQASRPATTTKPPKTTTNEIATELPDGAKSFRAPAWKAKVSYVSDATTASSPSATATRQGKNPNDLISNALKTNDANGFRLRSGLPTPQILIQPSTESELIQVIDATYRQLLNRLPLDAERLITAESKLRDCQIDLAGFVEQVALSDLFQQRLSSMAPLRAASAAALALLGRAATTNEVLQFITTRALSGQPAAVKGMINLRAELKQEAVDTVPTIDGMESQPGSRQSTAQRTAALYRGNAGLNPPPGEAI